MYLRRSFSCLSKAILCFALLTSAASSWLVWSAMFLPEDLSTKLRWLRSGQPTRLGHAEHQVVEGNLLVVHVVHVVLELELDAVEAQLQSRVHGPPVLRDLLLQAGNVGAVVVDRLALDQRQLGQQHDVARQLPPVLQQEVQRLVFAEVFVWSAPLLLNEILFPMSPLTFRLRLVISFFLVCVRCWVQLNTLASYWGAPCLAFLPASLRGLPFGDPSGDSVSLRCTLLIRGFVVGAVLNRLLAAGQATARLPHSEARLVELARVGPQVPGQRPRVHALDVLANARVLCH